MPRGQKSKLRAREKRHHDRSQAQGLKDAQAATAEEEQATSSSSPDGFDSPSNSGAAVTLPEPASAPAAPSATAGASCQRSSGGARSRGKKKQSSSRAYNATTATPGQDVVDKKVGMLVQFLLCKYIMNEPISSEDMLKIVPKSFREKFPEILEKAVLTVYLIYSLELKEVRSKRHTYTLVCNSDVMGDENLSGIWRFPTGAILMPLLGLIFFRYGRASEKEVWEILNMWGIYEGSSHFLFGDPRKLLTQDLVKEKYLEYRQVPSSDPPRFEFLWGSRAHAETSKMKVLEFWSKINGAVPSDYPCHYEEALRDEEVRAQATAATMVGTTSKSSGHSRATCSHYSHPE